MHGAIHLDIMIRWRNRELRFFAWPWLRILDEDHLEEEKSHILVFFKNNGYNKHDGVKDFQNASRGPRRKEHIEEVFKVFLPYIQGTTYKIAKVLKKKNIGATFKPLSTISNSLKSIKDPIDPANHKVV